MGKAGRNLLKYKILQGTIIFFPEDRVIEWTSQMEPKIKIQHDFII